MGPEREAYVDRASSGLEGGFIQTPKLNLNPKTLTSTCDPTPLNTRSLTQNLFIGPQNPGWTQLHGISRISENRGLLFGASINTRS